MFLSVPAEYLPRHPPCSDRLSIIPDLQLYGLPLLPVLPTGASSFVAGFVKKKHPVESISLLLTPNCHDQKDSMTIKTWIPDWLQDLFASIATTTDYNQLK
jgi:hypothetical protein